MVYFVYLFNEYQTHRALKPSLTRFIYIHINSCGLMQHSVNIFWSNFQMIKIWKC